MPHNIRMHLTGYSELRPLPPAGDPGREASQGGRVVTLERVRSLLLGLIADHVLQAEKVKEFQDLVWKESGPIAGANKEQDEAISTLAYDLDFFEPDDRARAEAPSYFGEDRARSGIAEVLRTIGQGRET